MTINVAPVNDAPRAAGDNVTVTEDIARTLIAPGILINDVDDDNDPMTVQLLSLPTHTLSFSNGSDGSFTYVPATNFFGDDQFTYVAAWEFQGVGMRPLLHKEPLVFEEVHPSQRSYK